MATLWAAAARQPNSPRVDFSEAYDVAGLKGRSALITGGATGIGEGIVRGLAEAGAYVTIADLAEKEGEALAEELKGKGHSVQFVKTDVTSWSSIIAAFKATIASSPRETIDIVVPNAGVAGGGMYYWLSNTEADAETGEPKQPPQHVVGVNFVGVYNTVHAAAWYFKNHPGPVEEGTTPKSKLIVLVASMGGYQAMPTVCDYNASKWGVRGLFYSLRNLDGLLGPGKPQFRVNLIAPTWVKTNMTKGMSSRMDENSTVKMAEVSDCVDVVLRMAADENIKGRAAAIAADKKSFDVSDDSDGLGGYKTLTDPEYQKLFGYGTMAEKPVAQKSSDAVAETPAPPIETAATAPVPPAAVVELQNGV